LALSSVERLIARRMTETKATVPEFTIRMTADMSACLEFRQRLRAERRRAPSLNDMIVKACGLALSRHPRVNGSYRDGEIELHGRVNVGIAVAGEGTLLVPTIFDADSRPLADIARESVRLVESARAGTLTPPELDGGTFTISNLGMFGVEEFSAIINAPQAAILAVGAVRRADGGALMTMTLTCDHRILYGADAAAFLGDVRRYLEEPLTMLL
jgi:pyruvate dehydrogenase E2 component (dihydrolipoamide acetyltransferase)